MATAHHNDMGEIELIIGPQNNSDGSTSTASVINRIDDINVAVAEAAGVPRTASFLKNTIDSTIFAAKYITFCIVSVAIYFPIFQVSMIAFYCSSSGKLLSPSWMRSWRTRTEYSGVYHKMNQFETPKNKLRRVVIVSLARLGCLAISWLVVSLCVPQLRSVTLFRCVMWKWSLLGTLLSLGYPCTYNSVIFFRMTFVDALITQAHDGYYVVWGLLNDALASLLYFGWILVAWLLYFRTQRGLNLSPGDVVDFITWTLVSVLVGTILWVLKRVLLLQWMADAIHRRFKARILMAGFQLFFLSTIVDGLRFRFLVPSWFDDDQKPTWDMGHKIYKPKDRKDTNVSPILKGRSVMSNMLSKHASLQQINVIAGYIADLAEVELRDSEHNIVEIIKKYRQKIGAGNESMEYVTEEAIRNWLEDDEAELLIAALLAEFPNKTINQVPFLKWMVAAHKNCSSLGNTLIDAYAVVSVLDMILTGCIVVVVALLWLLVTELATTKVLIVIASPFLAFTYIFGDACVTFFQGLVFSFVTHPFDVGDRCIIDGVEVEVKRISILTTTCIKIETKEKMLYPNSELVTKIIINLESKHDPSDVIELCLDPDTSKSKILRLRRSIRNFLCIENQRNLYQKSCRVIVKEIGDSIKISIHFEHTADLQDISHSGFFLKKKTQRSKMLIKIKELLEDLRIKIAHS